jgi:hypothetical protein
MVPTLLNRTVMIGWVNRRPDVSRACKWHGLPLDNSYLLQALFREIAALEQGLLESSKAGLSGPNPLIAKKLNKKQSKKTRYDQHHGTNACR